MTTHHVTQTGTARILKAFDADFLRRVLAVASSSSASTKMTTSKSVTVRVPPAQQTLIKVAQRSTPAITQSQSQELPHYMVNEAEYIRQFGY